MSKVFPDTSATNLHRRTMWRATVKAAEDVLANPNTQMTIATALGGFIAWKGMDVMDTKLQVEIAAADREAAMVTANANREVAIATANANREVAIATANADREADMVKHKQQLEQTERHHRETLEQAERHHRQLLDQNESSPPKT